MKKSVALHLSKQNFKFSSAHFLIFDDRSAEMLHGHNYQVRVQIAIPEQMMSEKDIQGKIGYAIDFNIIKKYIKSELDRWDEHILLPRLHPDMKYKISADRKNHEVSFRDRFYSFPADEIIWLDVTNTSVEQLSQVLAENFIHEFSKYGIRKIKVEVEETRGQSASTTLSKV
ncbi:MAG: 6-pyruvoyl trahydropterin synthase family protein [Pseudobdellovibrio sp.]